MIDKMYKERVLIKIEDAQEEEEQNYMTPQGFEQEVRLFGTVVAKGANTDETTVGDVVVFGEFDFSTITIEGEKYILTKEDNLICKLKENE